MTACESICQALQQTNTPALRAAFVGIMSAALPMAEMAGLRPAMQRALTERWARPQELAPAACALAALRRPISIDDPLLRTLLTATPICHPDVERALTGERHRLLRLAIASKAPAAGAPAAGALATMCVLARQGWINEYAWRQAPEEDALVAGLRDELQAALDAEPDALGGRALPVAQAIALAMYRPLGRLRHAERLAAGRPLPFVAAVFTQQIAQPAEEAHWRARIPRSTAIDDPTSLAVRDQYEENPYPRWIAPPAAGPRRPYAAWLADRFPGAQPPAGRPLDVLVAGCGTGQHPLDLARCFSDVRLLAIDLSLASLAYAARMTERLQVGGIEYRQADLLHADRLERSFDVIETSGVLHHLDDLWAGWRALLGVLRPGGVMMVSLYTMRGRADVRAARGWIAQRGFATTPDGIRQCRAEMMALPDPWARDLCLSPDFASSSGCRDLLFHVHESAVTLPELAAFLGEQELTLLEVETPPAVRHAFVARAGAAHDLDLGAWDRFEEAHPATFKQMIHLWVKKAIGTGK